MRLSWHVSISKTWWEPVTLVCTTNLLNREDDDHNLNLCLYTGTAEAWSSSSCGRQLWHQRGQGAERLPQDRLQLPSWKRTVEGYDDQIWLVADPHNIRADPNWRRDVTDLTPHGLTWHPSGLRLQQGILYGSQGRHNRLTTNWHRSDIELARKRHLNWNTCFEPRIHCKVEMHGKRMHFKSQEMNFNIHRNE